MSERKSVRQTLYCSFCGKSQYEVGQLIAGGENLVTICNECVDCCVDIIKEERNSYRCDYKFYASDVSYT